MGASGSRSRRPDLGGKFVFAGHAADLFETACGAQERVIVGFHGGALGDQAFVETALEIVEPVEVGAQLGGGGGELCGVMPRI